MQWDQWQTAKQQLLSHLHRSGVTRIPTFNAENVAKATQWLELQGLRAVGDAAATNVSTLPSLSSTSVSASVATATSASLTTSAVPIISTAPPNIPSTAAASTSAVAATGTAMPGNSTGSTTPVRVSTVRQPALANSVLGDWHTKAASEIEREQIFDGLRPQVAACRKCTDIFCYRQRTVFGVGPSNAKLVMFGEAPGADEDRAGEPFVGAAGQLLNKILEASGLKRENVYIMNALKCRPPNNRTPTELEIENCRPFFEAQLEAIQPQYIVCWGSVAVRAVLRTTESVGRLRGKFHAFRGAKVLVTYHPAYLLRNPDAKKLTWEDMKLLMKELGIPVPTPKNAPAPKKQ